MPTGGESADRLQSHAKACAKVSVTPDAAVYARGYEAGPRRLLHPGARLPPRRRRPASIATSARSRTEAAFLGRYIDGLESALVRREAEAIRAEADFERALVERAAIFKGQSAKKADAEVDAARSRDGPAARRPARHPREDPALERGAVLALSRTDPAPESPRRGVGSGGPVVLRHEPQRHPVVAPALAGRRGAVLEHVALMAAAAHAVVLGPRQDELEVARGVEVARESR